MSGQRWLAVGAAAVVTGLVAWGAWTRLGDDGADAEQDGAQVAAPLAPPPRVEPVPSSGIDWASAQADIAAQREKAGESGLAQVASGGTPAPVPVLLPTGIVQPQNARPPAYRVLDDGYFATFQGVKYDIIVNGTIIAYDTPGEAGTQERRDYAFTATDSGAQIALSRYGADYLIEFECNVLEAGNTCITEAEALEIAENLVVTGGQ